MKILLATLLLLCVVCFTQAQAPTAAALVNAYRCRSADCVDSALSTVSYMRVKPVLVNKYRTVFMYKHKADGEEVVYVNSDNYFVHFTTNEKAYNDTLLKQFKDLGFEQQSFHPNTYLEEQTADMWTFMIPGDYTIFLGVIYYKKQNQYSFALSAPR